MRGDKIALWEGRKMKKAEMMDQHLETYEEKISSTEIWHTVDLIYKINLDEAPIVNKEMEGMSSLSGREAIDSFLQQYEGTITGARARSILNEMFGVNLDAISSLEGARLSLYSKGQWIVQHEKDLFVVHTGAGDIDVKVYPTNYFLEQTGLKQLPTNLQQELASIGYYFDDTKDSYYYSNPTGEAVSDAFKGKTIGAILGVIQQSFAHL
ncbi:hypothetical protein CNQ87_19895 [Lysinibacillus fusiformis]|nr:hypothetical protein BB14905_03450 [Bacillus sp. B14905]PCD80836.1 hypothetical protein CNQ87_19895 [Lysinibacillus fusiformis]